MTELYATVGKSRIVLSKQSLLGPLATYFVAALKALKNLPNHSVWQLISIHFNQSSIHESLFYKSLPDCEICGVIRVISWKINELELEERYSD